MGANQRKRAAAREAQKAATRAAIAEQYELPKSAVAPSQPNHLGKAMFLSKRETKKFFSSQHAKQNGIAIDKPETWNGKKESK